MIDRNSRFFIVCINQIYKYLNDLNENNIIHIKSINNEKIIFTLHDVLYGTDDAGAKMRST